MTITRRSISGKSEKNLGEIWKMLRIIHTYFCFNILRLYTNFNFIFFLNKAFLLLFQFNFEKSKKCYPSGYLKWAHFCNKKIFMNGSAWQLKKGLRSQLRLRYKWRITSPDQIFKPGADFNSGFRVFRSRSWNLTPKFGGSAACGLFFDNKSLSHLQNVPMFSIGIHIGTLIETNDFIF